MKKKILTSLAMGLMIFGLTGLAGAAPFAATLSVDAGPLNGGSQSYQITAPSTGSANLTFDLLGYNSLDGANCCSDTFTLTVNGSQLFSGGFNMGGGGSNFVNYIAPGATVVSSVSYGSWAGGLTKFSVDHALLAGTNTYVFDYGSMQGLGDEGWGLANAKITGNVATPEPATMLLLGSGVAGLLGARRKKIAQA